MGLKFWLGAVLLLGTVVEFQASPILVQEYETDNEAKGLLDDSQENDYPGDVSDEAENEPDNEAKGPFDDSEENDPEADNEPKGPFDDSEENDYSRDGAGEAGEPEDVMDEEEIPEDGPDEAGAVYETGPGSSKDEVLDDAENEVDDPVNEKGEEMDDTVGDLNIQDPRRRRSRRPGGRRQRRQRGRQRRRGRGRGRRGRRSGKRIGRPRRRRRPSRNRKVGRRGRFRPRGGQRGGRRGRRRGSRSSRSGCPLRDYKGSNFDPNGWDKFVRVENGFLDHALNINRYAGECGVKLFIISSFRKHIPSGGATRSNHMVGRAIDVNLSWSGGFCNNDCLGNEARLPSGPRCFVAKIRNDPSLRWGGDFNDPGHIDDGLNIRNPAEYDRLRALLQPNCSEP